MLLDPEQEPGECLLHSQGLLTIRISLPSRRLPVQPEGVQGPGFPSQVSGEVWGRGTGADPQPQEPLPLPLAFAQLVLSRS